MTEHRADKYLKVESVLTAEEKHALLEAFFETAPHQRGAHVADILSVLDDTDSYCGDIDELWESGDGPVLRPEMTKASLTGLFTPCWHACFFIGRAKPTWPQVKALVERVQAAPPV
jgi:hypothetical protein